LVGFEGDQLNDDLVYQGFISPVKYIYEQACHQGKENIPIMFFQGLVKIRILK